MPTTPLPDAFAAIEASLRETNADLARRFPGESPDRQPVHTVYGGAHLFKAGTAPRLGAMAVAGLDRWAPNPGDLATVLGLDETIGTLVEARVREKLGREAVEDFRIDFEDGYGHRGDDEEDACAVQVGVELAAGMAAGTLPPFIGIRIKPLSAELASRGLRTLGTVIGSLLDADDGRAVLDRFVVTLPKVQTPAHVAALADAFDALEAHHGIAPGTLKLELMIETTQSIFAADGRVALPALLDAARGRCVAAHFGVYDYTAGCSITAQHQAMGHPVCDFARHVMQVALGGTGVWLSDGATNVMPVGDDAATVHRAWRLHYDDVRHSLRHGYYQGWDLHPAQFPTRYAAVYAFFLESVAGASTRLHHFIDQAAKATLAGDIFDDAATGQGLLNFFLRGINCGAITEAEATAAGVSLDELRTRSFARILAGRG